ncbi:hypothetical protein TARUN_6658 [Trichoderma arundinaceum]|uniref:YTH domain-containing protein n=1 Tax=Trichoderma arundinaceum TaxID=490622 RepID=A0A395NHN1_TRIAR|nr:hypothetical protein TARUN_6658 [Trichoderma arundinaceum]
MGEVSASSDSGTGNVDPILPEPIAEAPVVPQNQLEDHEQTTSGHDSRQNLPSGLAISQQTASHQGGPASSSTFFNRHAPFTMTSSTNTLPLDNYHHGQYQRGVQQRYTAGLSPPMAPPMPPIHQYTGPSPLPMAPQGFYVPQTHHIPPYYGGGHLPVNQVNTTMLQRQSVAYYQNPIAMGHPPAQYFYPQAAQYPIQISNVQPVIAAGPHPRTEIAQLAPTGSLAKTSKEALFEGLHVSLDKPAMVSGNAVWIGNLPPQTDLMSLVRHVSKETAGLESLFLIAKSNCAFANFKDEPSCIAAQLKLHESRFQSVRLVSRLRKNEIEGTAGLSAPTGPASGSTSSSKPINQIRSKAAAKADGVGSAAIPDHAERSTTVSSGAVTTYHDRFFILKSLAVDDLELSVRTGIWATQAHNEETLSNAFRQCNNVYLIFSANKSGEYFGYARMASEFSPSLDSTLKFAPAPRPTNEVETSKEVLTDATEYVPKGRIIDDPTRGTVFWEIYQENSEKVTDNDSNIVLDGKDGTSNEEEEERSWGKPFRIEWLSTSRLPFHRIRGLRNPWNSNREVKIARDGTEIEPSVGQRLIGLFNNVHGAGLSVASRSSVGGGPRYQQMSSYAQ